MVTAPQVMFIKVSSSRGFSSAAWGTPQPKTTARQSLDPRVCDPALDDALPLLLLIVMVLATWAPVRRTSLVDPMRTLRDE